MFFFKRHTLKYIIPILPVFFFLAVCGQVHELPPNQPEQDACAALLLCGNNFYTPYSYTGTGKVVDLSNCQCNGAEDNSVWLKVIIVSSGRIVFRIIPVSADDDYDFAVLNITNRSCSNIDPQAVVRCNFNNNIPGSNVNGVIGLDTVSNIPDVVSGTTGTSFLKQIDAVAGETYLVMINNFGNYVSGGASQGFTIDFTGSTAIFGSGDPPKLNSIDVPCGNALSIALHLNTEVLCSSIAANGSDFTSTVPVGIISASGNNCSGDSGYTDEINIGFLSAIPTGNYFVSAQKGSDGNTLLSLCKAPLQLPSTSIPFTAFAGNPPVIDIQFICYEQLPYVWNNITVNAGGDAVATYTTSSSKGCDSVTVLNLSVGSEPVYKNFSGMFCEGQFYKLPWDSTVTTTGTFTHHYLNSIGCDSLIENFAVTDSGCIKYIYVPTAFTPNKDFLNDIFKPTISGRILQYHLSVYNRWGKRIFFTSNYTQGWDGTISSLPQPAGVYIWVCDYQLSGQDLYEQKGTVTLIR